MSKSGATAACRWSAWLRRSSRNGCWSGQPSEPRLEWNRAAERVEQVTALLYDQLVLEETRAPAPDTEEAAQLLAAKALEVDIGRFIDREELEQLGARAAFAGIEIDVEAAATDSVPRAIEFRGACLRGLLDALRPPRIWISWRRNG